MKSLLALIAVACLAGTAFAQQSNPPQPNLENQKLAIWHGEWTWGPRIQRSSDPATSPRAG